MKNLVFAVIFLTVSAVADDLTVPNTFQAGTPARAADVNANFTAVEMSVDNNAAGIAANSSITSNNITEIQINATNIATNTAAIAANGAFDVYYRTAGGTPIINMSGQVHTERATCDDTNDKVIGGGYQLFEAASPPGYPQMIYESADADPNAQDAWEVRAIPNEDGQAVVAQVICLVVE